MPAPKKPRKSSPRTKRKRKLPAAAAKLKELWADPVWREELTTRRNAIIAEGRKKDPKKYTRFGVPDGMRKPESDKLWAIARSKAEEMHSIMVEDGVVAPLNDMERVQIGDTEDFVSVPTTDEQKASLALKEAMVMVLSPLSSVQTKQSAIRTVLEYTKKKPAQATDLNVTNAEAWLAQVAKDAKTEHEPESQPD